MSAGTSHQLYRDRGAAAELGEEAGSECIACLESAAELGIGPRCLGPHSSADHSAGGERKACCRLLRLVPAAGSTSPPSWGQDTHGGRSVLSGAGETPRAAHRGCCSMSLAALAESEGLE